MLCAVVVTCWAECNISTVNSGVVVKCNCKRHKTSFPADIPLSVMFLTIRNCIIPILGQRHMAPYKFLKSLDIFQNNLDKIEIDTFDSNLELQNFTIGNNGLNVSMLTHALCRMAKQNKKLIYLKMFYSKISSVDWTDMLRCLERMSLVFLDMSHNPIGKSADLTFNQMPSLETLNIADINHTFPINTQAFADLSKLKILRLGQNKLKCIPNFWDTDTNLTMLPNLAILDMSNNEIRNLQKESAELRNLEVLNIDHNRIQRITATDLSTLAPHLVTLSMRNNEAFNLLQSSFSAGLRCLYLDNCDITFVLAIKHKIFKHMINMKILRLSGNKLYRGDDSPGTMFQDMVNLTRLDLDNCRITNIYEHTFQGLEHLVYLSLTSNELSSLSPELFKPLSSLYTLHLDGNAFPVLSENVLRSLSPTLRILNVGRNPFVCNCNLLRFMKLFRGTTLIFQDKPNRKAYVCNSPPDLHNVQLSAFNITDRDCVHLPVWVPWTISLCSSLLVLTVIGTVAYIYRWHIGYLYFLLRAKRREARESQDDTQYVYDAFVVYNGTDVSWVKDELLPAMEEDAEFTLCVHDRDWLLGRDIVENIVQSIESSRKTLLVVSNAFAISQWCQLELTLAQHRILEDDRNAMILVLLEPLKRENITPRLSLQMKRQTYINWTEDPVGQALFWKKLRRALQKPVASIVHGSAINTRAVITHTLFKFNVTRICNAKIQVLVFVALIFSVH